MSDDDDFWPNYLADRHQLSSQLHAASQTRRKLCAHEDCKGRCDSCIPNSISECCKGRVRRSPHGGYYCGLCGFAVREPDPFA